MFTLGEILAASAERYPERPAVICPQSGLHWSFAEWNGHVNRLANSLVGLGITKGDRVSTFLGNSVELASCLFAAAKIGAVFNPVNPHLSPGELAFILNDTESKVLVFGREEEKKVEKARARIRTVEHYIFAGEKVPDQTIAWQRLQGSFSDIPPPVRVTENDWYSVIYTSGTTGRPKGVIHRHREIIDHSMCMIETQKLSRYDRGLAVAPMYHSAELHCFFIPRVHIGAANIVVKVFDPQKITGLMAGQKISIMFADPSRWSRILMCNKEVCPLPDFRLLAYGGAPMPAELAAKCRNFFEADLLHLYGMTEMGPAISVLYPEDAGKKPGSAGKALINHRIRVVKVESDRPSHPNNMVGPGIMGEIVVRGAGMMQGYYNRPELTARALYGGWYHTGDVGYFDREGYLWIFDRVDDAFIVGVDNVYPREIEEVLLEHPQVLEVAVTGFKNSCGETKIVAFLVREGENLTVEEVDGFLKDSERVAEFKIPKVYRFVDELPKLTTGKIPRSHLLKLYRQEC